MPIFAPVYKPSKHQQSYLARQQKLQSKKRKRGDETSDEEQTSGEQSSEPDPTPRTATTAFHPVNKRDPYYVAGHPREESLPPSPFPHAAVKEPSRAKHSVEEELANLNPPLYVPVTKLEDKSTSLKRRHLDNLTAVLHTCMLRGDWERASRAWNLLIRTEIAGRGIDIRRNGLWGIGAEVLMRQGIEQRREDRHRSPDTHDEEQHSSIDDEASNIEPLQFSDDGFKLAQEYYERLILQYPHTAYTQHFINATAFYPALFNIWIYEVQDRAKRARRKASKGNSSSSRSGDDSSSQLSFNEDQNLHIRQIRSQELEQALPIAQRMDDLLSSPPYDTVSSLLQLRGMVALWISDLHDKLAEFLIKYAEGGDDLATRHSIQERLEVDRHRAEAQEARQRATELFNRLDMSGVELPREALAFTSKEDD